MSFAEIKKAINSDLSVPLNEKMDISHPIIITTTSALALMNVNAKAGDILGECINIFNEKGGYIRAIDLGSISRYGGKYDEVPESDTSILVEIDGEVFIEVRNKNSSASGTFAIINSEDTSIYGTNPILFIDRNIQLSYNAAYVIPFKETIERNGVVQVVEFDKPIKFNKEIKIYVRANSDFSFTSQYIRYTRVLIAYTLEE